MKKYLFGMLAVAFAVVCFAFTAKLTPEGPDCDQQLYWFKVKPNVLKACSAIVLADLETIPDTDLDSTPDEVPNVVYTSAPHGCPDQTTYACALGFTSSQIQRVQIGGTFVFRPISDEVPQFECCIKKNS